MRTLKPSGIRWLGDVPDAWEITRIGAAFRERKDTVSDSDFQALSVTKNGVVPQLETAAKSDNSEGRKLIRKGDFVINSRSDRKGSSGLSQYDGSCSVIYTVLEPRGLDGRFVHHLLRSEGFQEEFYRWGSGIVADLWSTRFAAMKQIPVPLPPVEEQKAIAHFLDRETAQIDNLIAKQEELVVELNVRRAATISHVVRSGLNSQVETVQSINERMGKIPSHWTLARLKDVANVFPSNVDKKSYEGGTPVRLCNYVDVYYNDYIRDELDFQEATATSAELERFTLRKDWVIITKDSGSADDIGISAYVENDLPGVVCGYHLAIVSPKNAHSGHFLKWFFDSEITKSFMAERSNGLTRMALGQGAISTLPIAVPPPSEQMKIADYLRNETTRIDSLTKKARDMMTLLKERRSALISAAVTGKIDVRGQ